MKQFEVAEPAPELHLNRTGTAPEPHRNRYGTGQWNETNGSEKSTTDERTVVSLIP